MGGGGTPRNLSLPMSGHKPDEKFDSSFLTVVAGTVALNIIISFVYGLINNDKKVASSEKPAQLKTRLQKQHPI